ncbi:MAG: flagellar hook-basal body complex protein, partial [Pseudomonadota bacterium]
MIGSIYVGMSGLTAHAKGLRLISGNVANLNAPGFKAQAFRFTNIQSEGNPLLSGIGGSRAQDSYGVRFGETRTDFSQGDLRASSGDFDLAIDGPGFLVLQGERETFYARTAELLLDDGGFLIERQSGLRLAVLGDGNALKPFNLENLRTSEAVPTSRISFSGNLSSTGDTASVADIAVIGDGGATETWTVSFARPVPAVPGRWALTVTDSGGTEIGAGEIDFTGSQIDPRDAIITVTSGDPANGGFQVDLDFSENVTSFSSGTVSTIATAEIDGNAEGSLTAIAVTEQGAIELSYSNGETETLDRIAMTNFPEPQRL